MNRYWRKHYKRKYLARVAATAPTATPQFTVVELWRRGVRCRREIAAAVGYYASDAYCKFGRWQRAYGICTIPAVARLAPSQWRWLRRGDAA